MDKKALLMGGMGALRQRRQCRMTSREAGRGIVGRLAMLAETEFRALGLVEITQELIGVNRDLGRSCHGLESEAGRWVTLRLLSVAEGSAVWAEGPGFEFGLYLLLPVLLWAT